MTPSSSTSKKKNPKASPQHIADARDTALAGGGEMGARMRAFDWRLTPIGPVAEWPQSLKTAVRIILTSRYAMFVWWGRELINLYNDPYRSFLGVKHPDALGKSARDVWAEIWDQIGPRTDAVLFHGESTYDEALLLLMERYGYLEETYFTFSYSPLPDDKGGVGGLFCAVTEDTQRVIGERRLRLLREMASRMAEARTPVQVCQAAAQSLSSARRDLPFSLIYLLESDGKTLRRMTQAGIASSHPAATDLVSLDGDVETVWPFRQVIETGEVTLVEKLTDRLTEIPTGEWAHAPQRAVLVPIARQGQAHPAGLLIAGLNPHLQFDDEFRGFVSLLTNQIAASVANADAVERETELRAQAELERRRLQELLAQAPALIGFMSGSDHRWTYVNDLCIRVTGRASPEEFIGKTMRESLPEMKGQGLFELLDQIYQSGQPLVGREMKVRFNRSASGQPEEAYLNFVYQPIRDAGGKIDGILLHAVEVTDQVAVRKAIALSEERLRLAQTAAQIGTWEWDAVRDTRTLSPELHRIFGTDVGDPQYAQVWESRVHPADWPRVRNQMEAGSRSGSMEFEYRYRHPENGLRWFSCKGARLDEDTRMLGVLLDITDRKQAELRSAAQHKLSRALADSADMLQAAPQILRSICEAFDWNVGALWVVGRNDDVLRCLESWCDPEGKAMRFAAASRNCSFAHGVGLPGRIWASGEMLWIPDLLFEDNLLRSEGARAEGFHAAFGFPVILRDRFWGVLEFFSSEIRQTDDASLQMMASVSTQIGQYIERVEARDALRDSEERYRTMTETASDAIVSIDEQSTILFANSAIAQVFGYRPEELIGKNLTMLMPDYMRRMHEAGLNRYVEIGQKHLNWDAAQLPGLHKDGRVIPLELSFGEYVKDGQRYFTGFARDITSRKQVAEARDRLAAIVESTDDAIVGKDLNGIVTSWNAAAERMFGYRPDEIIGRSVVAIIPSELRDDEVRILETIARGERIHHYETVRVTKGGERISVSLTISPVRDGAGRIVGAAKIARNITEQKKTEQTLHTAERLASVGRLAATVAHEINNPLEAVINLVYLAQASAVQKNVQEYLAGAEEELERISQLTKQTLGFYRNTKGAMPIRIGSVLEALLSVFSSRIRNKSIEIRPEIRQDPEIVAVPGEIRQLFANLLSNSIDAVDSGGFIRIRVSAATVRNGEDRPGVRLTVADSGPGIPSAVRSKLFQPFFTTKKDVGTGLGLWVCKNIVEKHGGNLRVHSSVRPGRSWTAFSVFLPQNPPSSLEQSLEAVLDV